MRLMNLYICHFDEVKFFSVEGKEVVGSIFAAPKIDFKGDLQSRRRSL
jgi:hypothetical protein